ncbi:RsmB/NOP family class I SAM-dependent RNA methyltransferase [Sphingomonas oligophenolica]|uniref:RsmB/NOP family class I SAM-dependent RNA methyltransferase n=1 Tax=Sphingomonas oligophenolica TaxID=301154 RepID=A0ABU9Y938_9SPHN
MSSSALTRPPNRNANHPAADPPGVPARRAALKLLDAVLRQGLPLEAALDRATQGIERSDDRALAHAIAAEALRRLPDLDALIDSATRSRLPDDAKARFALRIALVQALALGTPPHAAISTVLPLVDGGPRKLVHGVFGTLMRGGATLEEFPTLPEDVEARWQNAWGEEKVAAAERAIAVPPPLDLTLADPARTEELTAEMGGLSLLPGHIRLAGAHVPELPGFEEGAWWVQDIAASLPARLIGKGSGIVLDLCSAPGGKTMQLASAGWSVVSVDSSESRLARLRDNLARTHLAAEVIAADLLKWSPAEPADAVLLDAPCSATGIFRRHPDVLHRVNPRVIAEMARVQAQLLARAAKWVKPGGMLVYATCSLEKAEGEEQLMAFLASQPDFAIDPVAVAELPAGIVPHQRGWVRTLPGMLAEEGGCDGFFIARLRRGG